MERRQSRRTDAMIDPLREWLGIDASHGPLSYYELLGLPRFEADSQRIENAEMFQMGRVLRHEDGPHKDLARRLCEELETAVACLLDPAAKADYDAKLRYELAGSLAASVAAPETDPGQRFPKTSANSAANPSAPVTAPHADRRQAKPPPKKRPARKQAGGESTLANLPLANVAICLAILGGAYFAVTMVQSWLHALPDAGPTLAKLQSSDPQVRLAGVGELRSVEITPAAMAQHLLELIEKDADNDVRDAAARELASLGPAVLPILARLKDLLAKEQHMGVKVTLEWIIEQQTQS
jgi:hypothetical protein